MDAEKETKLERFFVEMWEGFSITKYKYQIAYDVLKKFFKNNAILFANLKTGGVYDPERILYTFNKIQLEDFNTFRKERDKKVNSFLYRNYYIRYINDIDMIMIELEEYFSDSDSVEDTEALFSDMMGLTNFELYDIYEKSYKFENTIRSSPNKLEKISENDNEDEIEELLEAVPADVSGMTLGVRDALNSTFNKTIDSIETESNDDEYTMAFDDESTFYDIDSPIYEIESPIDLKNIKISHNNILKEVKMLREYIEKD